MQRFGLNRARKVLLVIVVVSAIMSIGLVLNTHQEVAKGNMELAQQAKLSSSSLPQEGVLQAFIFGNPTPNNPFAGVAYDPALNATLPPAVTFYVLGWGNSSVQISWTGATNAITQDFDYNTTIPYTFGAGDYLVEISISSPSLGLSKTIAYNIQVMNYTQYISYENGLSPVKSLALQPWYVQYEAAELGVTLTAFAMILFFSWANISLDIKERVQKIFKVR